VRPQQTVNLGPQCGVLSARAIQVGGPFGWGFLLNSGLKDFFGIHRVELP
jgi:hypothetical protein